MPSSPPIGPKGVQVHDKNGIGIDSEDVSGQRALIVKNVGAGGSSGTQYTEGDIDPTIVGTAMLAENSLSPDELRPLQVDNSDYLMVTLMDAPSVVSVNDGGGTITVDIPTTVTVQPGGAGTWDDATVTGIGDPLPINASLQGFSDGTNLQSSRVFDLDTGAGSQYVQGVSLRSSASGGSFEITGRDLANSNPLNVAMVDANGDQITSFGGGTQYTEGDTDATITGTAFLWEDTSDTLRAVSASKPLPVGIASTVGVAGKVAEGDSVVGVNPVLIAGEDSSAQVRNLELDTLGALKVSAKSPLTASSPTFATVGVASGAAVASNASRKGLVLVNTSTAVISFGIGAAAVLNSGITLLPYGVWVMDEHTFTTAAINAIASAAASNLSVQELT